MGKGGQARMGSDGHGPEWQGAARQARRGLARRARKAGMEWQRLDRTGMEWQARKGADWIGPDWTGRQGRSRGHRYGASNVVTPAKTVTVAPFEIATSTAKPLAAPRVPAPLAFQETEVSDQMTAPMSMSPVTHETDAPVMLAPTGTNPDISSW